MTTEADDSRASLGRHSEPSCSFATSVTACEGVLDTTAAGGAHSPMPVRSVSRTGRQGRASARCARATCSLAVLWLAAVADAGGGQPAVITCETGAGELKDQLLCTRNTTHVGNATEVVEIHVTMEAAMSTQILVPGYKVFIHLPQAEAGFTDPFGITDGMDELGVGGVILGNLAAMGMLIVFCGIMIVIEAKFKVVGGKQMEEMHKTAAMFAEVADISGVGADGGDSDDEGSLHMGEGGEGFGLSSAGGAAKMGNRARKGDKSAMFSIISGVVRDATHDPRMQEMAHQARDVAAEKGINMSPTKGKKVMNPMRDSSSAGDDSPLSQGLLGEASHAAAGLAHKGLDTVGDKAGDSALAEEAKKMAHKGLDKAHGGANDKAGIKGKKGKKGKKGGDVHFTA